MASGGHRDDFGLPPGGPSRRSPDCQSAVDRPVEQGQGPMNLPCRDSDGSTAVVPGGTR